MTDNLTPRQIVAELDRYIVGQDAAKRAVAVAIRNRWRRQQLPPELRKDVTPKNIIMIGPTGVGKTEIARRLAQLVGAPFIKVEATKYTEVGYVGRDVESMVRDLTEAAVGLVKQEQREQVEKAKERVTERLLDLLVPNKSLGRRRKSPKTPTHGSAPATRCGQCSKPANSKTNRSNSFAEQKAGPQIQIFSTFGHENMDVDLQDMLQNLIPKQPGRGRCPSAKRGES